MCVCVSRCLIWLCICRRTFQDTRDFFEIFFLFSSGHACTNMRTTRSNYCWLERITNKKDSWILIFKEKCIGSITLMTNNNLKIYNKWQKLFLIWVFDLKWNVKIRADLSFSSLSLTINNNDCRCTDMACSKQLLAFNLFRNSIFSMYDMHLYLFYSIKTKFCHRSLINTQRKRILFHFIPTFITVFYPCLFYFAIVILNSCQNSWNYDEVSLFAFYITKQNIFI